MNDDDERSETGFIADPGAAIAALGPVPVDPNRDLPPPGKPGSDERRVYDREKKRRQRDRTAPARGGRGTYARDKDPRTRAELLAQVQAQEARLAMLTASGADLQAAKDCIAGIVTVLNMGAEFAMARELTFTKDEQLRLGELWGPPSAPYLAKLGSAQPWVAAVAGTAFMVWPKWMAYIDRKDAEKVDVKVETPAPGSVEANTPGAPAEVHTHPELVP